MAEFKRSEGKFKGYDGIPLFYQDWLLTSQKSKGLLVITHGQGEHSDCYNRFIQGVSSLGWSMCAWDWRGHGRSEGKRGFALDFEEYVKDYQIFLDLVLNSKEYADLPIVLTSHSMGGLIQLTYLSRAKEISPRIKAQTLSAPLLAVPFEVNPIKDGAARLANRIYPKLTLWNELNTSQFTRDTSVLAEYPKDPLRHDRISPGVYLGFLRCAQEVMEHAAQIKLPSLLQLAGKDSVVSTPKAQDFFGLLGSSIKKLKIYPDSFHEIYNDLDRTDAFSDFIDFVRPFG